MVLAKPAYTLVLAVESPAHLVETNAWGIPPILPASLAWVFAAQAAALGLGQSGPLARSIAWVLALAACAYSRPVWAGPPLELALPLALAVLLYWVGRAATLEPPFRSFAVPAAALLLAGLAGVAPYYLLPRAAWDVVPLALSAALAYLGPLALGAYFLTRLRRWSAFAGYALAAALTCLVYLEITDARHHRYPVSFARAGVPESPDQ